MPVMDRTAALPGLVAAGARVLVLTLSEEDATVLTSVRAGASGYLVKGVPSDRLLTAVRGPWRDGHAVFGPGLALRLLAPGDPGLPELSTREREVMEHVARGLTNVEIAEALVISPVTVRNHVSWILMKLQLTNLTQAVIRFREGRRVPVGRCGRWACQRPHRPGVMWRPCLGARGTPGVLGRWCGAGSARAARRARVRRQRG